MTQCSANFETGTLAATIATTDTGDATAWDSVAIGGGCTIKYDDTHVVVDAQSAKQTSSGFDSNGGLIWSTALGGPLTDYYWRVYVYMEDLPSGTGDHYVIEAHSGGNWCWMLEITSGGAIRIRDTSFNPVSTFTATFPTDQWVRFEGHTVHTGGSNGDVEVKLFLTATSTSPDETKSVTNQVIRSNVDTVNFSLRSLSTTEWLDGIIFGATDWVGPVQAEPQSTDVLSMQAHVFGHNMW